MSKSLLIVDDDELVSAGVAMALEDSGFRVTIIDRGRPVPDLVAVAPPDAVLLDVSLPDINGVEVARALRSRWPDLPIVFTTGHDADAGVREMLAQNRTSMLQKPFAIQDLLTIIGEITR
ncbi:MAG TPA: response regulator [Thermoanaerobaculia bacterium]|nr:response regulator [Thermoanaerobaculia bacterium]